jgi:hypothetical protein
MELRLAIKRRWSLWKWDIEKPVLQYRQWITGDELGYLLDKPYWSEWKDVPVEHILVEARKG